MRKKIAVAVGFVLAGIVAIGCGSAGNDTVTPGQANVVASDTEQSAEGPASTKIGTPLTLHKDQLGDKLDITITVSNSKTYTKEPGDYGSKPKNGIFLVVNVAAQVAAGGTGSYHLNPFNFGFVAGDGTVYDYGSGMLATFPNDLDSADLQAGQKKSGTVVFDIKKTDMTGGKISLKGWDSSQIGYWTL